MLEGDETLGTGGQILVCESAGELEVGIQFGTLVEAAIVGDPGLIGAHELGVVAEEISHFNALMQAAAGVGNISALDLEVLGEIDRFLVFLHARQIVSGSWTSAAAPADLEGVSIAQLFDLLFEKRRFSCSESASEVYFMAEALALNHLKRAFTHCWMHSKVDESRCDRKARSYLIELRRAVTEQGASVRLLLECA
jgi:hypothetical protein